MNGHAVVPAAEAERRLMPGGDVGAGAVDVDAVDDVGGGDVEGFKPPYAIEKLYAPLLS
jgi:hypothetical protein